MTWWKRVLFSIISITGGWFSLDVLFTAFQYIRKFGVRGKNGGQLTELLTGAGLMIALLLLLTCYLVFLRRISGNLNIVEYDSNEEKPRVKSKWFDILLQSGILATGFFLHFMYLLVFYFPNL